MSEDFEKLKSIGIQKIYEDTHISREHLQAIINGKYKLLNKVQFVGFISILEREYSLDLSSLKTKGLEFFNEQEAALAENAGVFVVTESQKKYPVVYIVLAFVIIMGFAIFQIGNGGDKDVIEVQNVENEIILDVKKNIENTAIENNSSESNQSSLDLNSSENTEVLELEESVIEEEKPQLQEFSIEPKSRVWLGYIDVENYKRYQKTVKEKIELDPSKEWLVILGHSHAVINVNGENIRYKEKGNIYLHYKDGEVQKITVAEFKKLNRGRKW